MADGSTATIRSCCRTRRIALRHLVGAAGPDHELRITTAVSRTTRPFEGRARYANRDIDERGRTVLAQAALERLRNGGLFAVSGGFHRVSNDPQVTAGAAAANLERLLDGPPLAYADYANSASHVGRCR